MGQTNFWRSILVFMTMAYCQYLFPAAFVQSIMNVLEIFRENAVCIRIGMFFHICNSNHCAYVRANQQ